MAGSLRHPFISLALIACLVGLLAVPAGAAPARKGAERAVEASLSRSFDKADAGCRRAGRRRWACRWRAGGAGRLCTGRHIATRRAGRWHLRRGGRRCGDTRPDTVAQAPVTEAPVTEAPVTEAPVAEAPSTAAPPAKLFGFNDNAVMQRLVPASTDAALLAEVGADVARVTVDWRWAEPRRDDYRLEQYDRIYAELTARGVRPVFLPLFAPSWAIDPATPCDQYATNCRYPPAPAHDADYAEFAALLARRYPRAAAIEVWNEPNQANFWRPAPDPRRYAQLLQATYRAVKAAEPGMVVAGGAISDNPSSAHGIPLGTFARAIYAAGARGHMDVLSFHPYPHLDGLLDRSFTEIRAARASANDSSTPLWVTESGWTTTGQKSGWPREWILTEAQQAERLVELYRRLMGEPDVGAVMFHTLVEPTGNPLFSPGVGYGIVGQDLRRKPAYCALAAERGAPAACA